MADSRGIETLVALAAVDEALARLLLQDREAAVAQSGVELTQTERRVLTAIDDPALRAMIGRFAGGIAEEDRRSFLGRSATAILTLVAGGSLLGAGGGGGGGGGGIPGGIGGITPGIGGITPGRRHGSLGAPSRTRIIMRKLTVHGGLSRELVRRIIRRHINEVKYCYEKEQLKQPKLEGTLVLDFTVGIKGRVIRAEVSPATLKNRKVELCVQRAARRWLYPKPANGQPVAVNCELGLHPVKRDPPKKKKPTTKKPPTKKPPTKKKPTKKKPTKKKPTKKKPTKKKPPTKTTSRSG